MKKNNKLITKENKKLINYIIFIFVIIIIILYNFFYHSLEISDKVNIVYKSKFFISEKNNFLYLNKVIGENHIIIAEDKYIQPKFFWENMNVENISSIFLYKIGTYSSEYNESNCNRATNIKLSAQKINNYILMPGDEFSFNKILGERTEQAGYKLAPAYLSGKIVNEYGGGICQTSSTLYNAVLLANLEVTSRTGHFFSPSYIPIGRDATVSWGTLDFKFKNNKNYPIKICASSINGIVKVDILGIEQESEYEIIIQSKCISTIHYKIQYEEYSTLNKDSEVVLQNR